MTASIYMTKWLARFARREGITSASLREAIDRAERGLIDADLGGDLIKQRVARGGQGRSGGYRMLVAFCQQGRAVFLYGFAKSGQDNIGADELASLRDIAAGWLDADTDRMKAAMAANELQEVGHGEAET